MKKLIILYSFLLGASFTQCAHGGGAAGDDQEHLVGAILQSTGPLPEDRLFTALVSAGVSEPAAQEQAIRHIDARKQFCITSVFSSIGAGCISTRVWPHFIASMEPNGNIIGGTVCGGILCALGCGSAYALRIACYECTRDIGPEDIEYAFTEMYPDSRDTFKVLRTENREEFVLVPIGTNFAVSRSDHERLGYLRGARIRIDYILFTSDEEDAAVPVAPVIGRP